MIVRHWIPIGPTLPADMAPIPSRLPAALAVCALSLGAEAFAPPPSTGVRRCPGTSSAPVPALASAPASALAAASGDGEEAGGGDPLRASTGVRPSLHPFTINALADALLARHAPEKVPSIGDAGVPLDVAALDGTGHRPVDVAAAAARLSFLALERRKASCKADGDLRSIPTDAEGQTVAGRVVGIVMRMRELEAELARRVGGTGWVAKYGEHGSFGTLKSECRRVAEVDADADAEGGAGAGAGVGAGAGAGAGAGGQSAGIDPAIERELADRIRDDPLFRMCRAECLLAVFLHTVEGPRLAEIGEEVAGGSQVDFIDQDRREVLLQ